MGIYVITTGIMILLYFTMTKNHVLLMNIVLHVVITNRRMRSL